MIVSIDWIRQFVNLPSEVNNELAKKFTLATCEVEDVKLLNEHLTKVIVVEILATAPHPEADKLQLVTINTGNEEKVIVCGAPNARAGIKVPYAPVGTTLPGGFTLTAKKVRGILSEGMLCAETELEIGNDDSGLKEFPADAPVGHTLADYLKMPTDILFDIDNKSLTNRPDLWSQLGMAREFATVFKTNLNNPYNESWEKALLAKIPSTPSPVAHSISKNSCCKGYWGLAVKNVAVGESPEWMQRRLIACGMRPINSIVDISNYVLLELGIPNHIFDLTTIRGNKIDVKRPDAEMEFTTLDGQVRTVNPTDTLIWDAEGPVAIAGIMGGLDSGINDNTTTVFIESANFIDAEVRKTSTRLGLRTDASQRYEKSLDTHLLKRTSLRIFELLLELNPNAQADGALSYVGEDLNQPKLTINLEASKISRVLGKEISKEEQIDILTRLDFIVDDSGDKLSIQVPTYRATKDIECEADIIEEIGRVIGYDNIIPTPPLDAVLPVALSNEKKLARKLSDFMIYKQKAFEVMTYPMIGEALLKKTAWSDLNEELELVNAISADRSRMRPSIVPTMLESIALNSKNKTFFTAFEFGRSYKPCAKNFSMEENWFATVFYDRKKTRIQEAIDCCEEILSLLNLNGKIVETSAKDFFPENWIGLHPHENLSIQALGKTIGSIFSVHPLLKSKLKIKGQATILLLNLSTFESITAKDKTAYKPLPKFPGSEFDCTVIASNDVPVATLVDVIKKLKIKEAVKVTVADIFTPNESENAITLRTHFLDLEKTLDSSFLEDSKNKIIASLEKAGFPLKK